MSISDKLIIIRQVIQVVLKVSDVILNTLNYVLNMNEVKNG